MIKKLSQLQKKSSFQGFTLIEIIVVMSILSSLALATIVAINPIQRLQDARDARRTTDIQSILSAIHQDIVDNDGALPAGLTTNMELTQIGSAPTGCNGTVGLCTIAATSCINLSTPLQEYLVSIPADPSGGTAQETEYAVSVNANNIVTVTACGTEGSATAISASR